MKKHEFELYTDYLISRFGQATATGLSAMLDAAISHDKDTLLLRQQNAARMNTCAYSLPNQKICNGQHYIASHTDKKSDAPDGQKGRFTPDLT